MSADTLCLPRERPWRLWVFVLWGGILLALCVRIFLWPGIHNTFQIFAQAGRNWQAGAGLYGSVSPTLDVYRYSPLVAALLAPLAMLPVGLASALWILANAVVFLVALNWWRRDVTPSRVSFAVIALAVLPLTIASLHNGQSNALVIGLVLAGVAAVARERWNLAAGFIALATLLKLYPLAIGLLLVGLYPRKFAARLAIALGIGLLLPFLMAPPGYVLRQYADWVNYLNVDDRTLLPINLWMRDFRLLCRVWLVTPSPAVYLLIQVCTGGAIAGFCLAAARRGWSRRDVLTLLTGLGCCWMTLFGPGTEANTYVLLAPSLALALVNAWSGDCARWRRGLLTGIFALLLAGFTCKWFTLTRPFCDLGPHPLAGLLFFLLLSVDALLRLVRRQAPVIATQLPRAA